MAESFWASLKRELVDWSHFATHAEARAAVFEWINWYNHERLHTSLQMQSPHEFEQTLTGPTARSMTRVRHGGGCSSIRIVAKARSSLQRRVAARPWQVAARGATSSARSLTPSPLWAASPLGCQCARRRCGDDVDTVGGRVR